MDALVSAFLGVAIDRLASREVVDFFSRKKFDEMLLNELNSKLRSIRVLADDAEQKQFSNPTVKEWLTDVRVAVFDAEDLLDVIDLQLYKSQVETESESQIFISKVSNFLTDTFSSFDSQIESEMKNVLRRLDSLANQKGDLGLKETACLSSDLSHKLPSTSLVSDSVIYGRDDDKEIIFNWLTSQTDNINKLSILSIVGMGGLGKTTLARHIFNDERMKDAKFHFKIWVSVSGNFDVLNETRNILEKITKLKYDGDLEMLHGRLKEVLSEKRFFFVLDGVWNVDQAKWDLVQTPLRYGAQGSRILVTTRSDQVASVMRSNEVLTLKPLHEDQCWKIFVKHAFQDDYPHLNAEFTEIGKRIIEKCEGLPLALKTMGSLLRAKPSNKEWDNKEWEKVLRSNIWELSKEESEIIPALLFSYLHLPSHLKRCFVYCALFPKDYEFNKKDLILLWMAEGFLQSPQQSMSPEEVGDQYFNELLSRSFFRRTNYICFVMHGLLNDLAKYICGDICFRLGVDKGKYMPKICRHLSLVINNVSVFNAFGSSYDAERLHTFISTRIGIDTAWECQNPTQELLSKFKFLRVLSLFSCRDLAELPDSIGELKQLRSLDLSCTMITKLPDSTCSLYKLEILKLNNCPDLKELPLNLYKLRNLRYLEFEATSLGKMPMHLGRLENLQAFDSFYVGKSSEFSIKQLEGLNLHGELSIRGLQNIKNPSDALTAALENKIHLEKLQLEWDSDCNHDDPEKEKEILENLHPSKHLKDLSICNYGGKQLPSWLQTTNVVSILLEKCKCCLSLPPFGVLPRLKKLQIKQLDGIVNIGDEFYGSNTSSFTSLETLSFSNMKKWEKWECKVVFPCLQFLHIKGCPELREMPGRLLQVKKVDILCCRRLSISGYCIEATPLERISCDHFRIYGCPNMINFPETRCFNFLVALTIFNSNCLTFFPLDSFPNLHTLYLRKCSHLRKISQKKHHNHLQNLQIDRCPEFEFFPREGLYASSLVTFKLNKLGNLKALPEYMHNFLSLTELEIMDCSQVEKFSNGGLPSSITRVGLSSLKLIASLKGALAANSSLKILNIVGVDVESFPDEGFLPLSLTSLEIRDCSNLKKLDYMGLCQLSSLKELHIYCCNNLQRLPEEGLPNSISTLEIKSCELLRKRCQKLGGEDWRKIAHIKNLNIWWI